MKDRKIVFFDDRGPWDAAHTNPYVNPAFVTSGKFRDKSNCTFSSDILFGR